MFLQNYRGIYIFKLPFKSRFGRHGRFGFIVFSPRTVHAYGATQSSILDIRLYIDFLFTKEFL